MLSQSLPLAAPSQPAATTVPSCGHMSPSAAASGWRCWALGTGLPMTGVQLLATALTGTPGPTSFTPLWLIPIGVSRLIMNATHTVHQSPQLLQHWALRNPSRVNRRAADPAWRGLGGGCSRSRRSTGGGRGPWWAGGPVRMGMLGLGWVPAGRHSAAPAGSHPLVAESFIKPSPGGFCFFSPAWELWEGVSSMRSWQGHPKPVLMGQDRVAARRGVVLR